jgi:shikimate dehydrogenase
MPVDVSSIGSDVIVFDAIVKPEMTGLLTLARERGCRIVMGREMMRGQMARVVDFFGYPKR